MGILLFFVIFCLVVLVHEFGHFIIARMNGIAVREFTIGMGPKLVSFRRNGILYAIRLLPIGGACIFEGEDGKYEEDTEKKDAEAADASVSKEEAQEVSEEALIEETKAGHIPFPDAPVWGRIATVFAGPFFNFVLAFLFSMIIVGSYGADLPVIQKIAKRFQKLKVRFLVRCVCITLK